MAKGKKTTAPKNSTAKPLSNVENESFGLDGAAGTKKMQGDSSERYQQVRQAQSTEITSGVILIINLAYPD